MQDSALSYVEQVVEFCLNTFIPLMALVFCYYYFFFTMDLYLACIGTCPGCTARSSHGGYCLGPSLLEICCFCCCYGLQRHVRRSGKPRHVEGKRLASVIVNTAAAVVLMDFCFYARVCEKRSTAVRLSNVGWQPPSAVVWDSDVAYYAADIFFIVNTKLLP